MAQKIVLLILIILLISKTKSQKVRYLNDIEENKACELSDSTFGICKKTSDCIDIFEKYRRNQTLLDICKYDKNHGKNILICCPQSRESQIKDLLQHHARLDFTDYETCQTEYLKFREKSSNSKAYIDFILNFKKTIPEKHCNKINDLKGYTCSNGQITKTSVSGDVIGGDLVKLGEFPNMAAIGWTLNIRKVTYRCGGSIITTRFVLTVAHCKFYER